MVQVPVAAGQFTLHNASQGSADFTAKVVGYYDTYGTSALFLPDEAQLTGSQPVVLGAGRSVTVSAGACLGAPASEISAAAVTVSATGGKASGYLSAYPAGEPQAADRILSYQARTGIATSTILAARSGQITLHNASTRAMQVSVNQMGCYYQYPSPG